MLPHVPVGLQTVTARMPGFTTDASTLHVRKDATAQAGYLRLVPLSKPDAVPTLPPPATPTPEVTVVPTYLPPGFTTATPGGSPPPTTAPPPTATPSMQPQSGQI